MKRALDYHSQWSSLKTNSAAYVLKRFGKSFS
jgi:hypothetical protein